MPMTAVATQYSAKLCSHSASTAERAAADVDQRAGHEAAAAADPRHPQRHRHRRHRGAQHVGRRAERGERLGVDQRIADEPVHRDEAGARWSAAAPGSRRAGKCCGRKWSSACVSRDAGRWTVARRADTRAYGHRLVCAIARRPRFLVRAGSPSAAARACGFARTPRSTTTIRERFGDAVDAALAGGYGEWCVDARAARSPASCCSTSSRATSFATRRARSPATRARSPPRRTRSRAASTASSIRSSAGSCTCRSSTRKTSPRSSARSRCSARSPARRATHDALEWAQKHADVIFRFGRYPHRNAILGRASTPEEIAFLRAARIAVLNGTHWPRSRSRSRCSSPSRSSARSSQMGRRCRLPLSWSQAASRCRSCRASVRLCASSRRSSSCCSSRRCCSPTAGSFPKRDFLERAAPDPAARVRARVPHRRRRRLSHALAHSRRCRSPPRSRWAPSSRRPTPSRPRRPPSACRCRRASRTS